jgi:RND superfamily putative drug exporter
VSRFLHRLGHITAGHPWRTIGVWLVLCAALLTASATVGGTPQDNWNIPDARAQTGIELLRAHEPAAGYASARVVVHDPDGAALAPAGLEALTTRLSAMDHVIAVSPPRLSDDGDTALLTVQYDVEVTNPDLMGNLAPLEAAVAATRASGTQVELGGVLPDTAAAPMTGHGELLGVGVALIVLVLAFGSVVGAGLTVGVALGGLAAGSAGVTLLAAVMDVSTTAPTVATMVALGVGIDYALLLVTRHVEFLRLGWSPREAAARAVATAGRAVTFASATVLVSLLGLKLAGLPVYDAFGFATAIAVLAVAASALTLVPALTALAGYRLLPRRVRTGRPATARPLTARWAERVSRRPLAWAGLATLVLLVLAAPALDMRTWPQDASSQPRDLTTRAAYDLVASEFGAGANGPLTVAAPTDRVDAQAFAATAAEVAANPEIAAVTPVSLSPDGALRTFSAEPTFGPTDARVPPLVEQLRAVVPAGAEVTGTTALFADVADLLSHRLWLVVGFVIATSVVLLALVFRSVVVPLKAAAMNVLSIGAAYGVVTAVFQWGWGTGLMGLDHAVPVSSWLPILLFAILFGLSMDYEVFLLSRVREDWVSTGDPHGSVVRGLTASGRVITAAAAIMVAVFLGFATEVDVVVKQLGLGMAVAITVDATLVRMVLVPATMRLLGHRNWWMPTWLDRALPAVRIEESELATAEESGDAEVRVPAGV